jgi:hypothetical protein
MINKDIPIIVKQRSIGATSMTVDKLKQDSYNIASHEDITKFFEDMVKNIDLVELITEHVKRLMIENDDFIPIEYSDKFTADPKNGDILRKHEEYCKYYFGRKSNGRNLNGRKD